MTDVPLQTGAYRRDNGNLPRLLLKNMFVEQARSAPNSIALVSRNGLTDFATWGAGSVRGLHQEDGLFGGDTFAVIGKTLYRDGEAIGTINGTGPVIFAASQVEVVVTAGRDAYSYRWTDGAHDFAKIVLPDGFHCNSVRFLGGLFFFARADLVTGDASHRFYWSAPIDARSVDDLDFASAESSADPLRDIAVQGDNLVLLGSRTIETWMLSGNAVLPVTRISQRIFKKGVIQTGASAEFDNTLFFVGDNHTVYRIAEVPQRLSDHAIEERIAASSSVECFTFQHQGHEFFCVRLDTESWLVDAASGEWTEFSTLTRSNWRARCAAMIDGEPVFGDDTEGKLLRFEGYSDTPADLERLFTVAFSLTQTTIIDTLEIECNVGWTEAYSGEGADPVLEMRTSRDGGRNWSSWRAASMGGVGEYRTRVRWRRLGYFDAPGFIAQFRLSDPAPLRVTRCTINESGGGRSR